MRARLVRLTPVHVNLALEILVVIAIVSGLVSWSLSDRWNGAATFVHGASGISIALLVPAKLRGSVRSGFKRGRTLRWVSSAFGVLVLATLSLGLLHATGVWYGVGYWSALWTHELLGFMTIPLLIWHVTSRPSQVAADHLRSRRTVLRFGAVAGTAAILHVAQRASADAVGLAGGERRATGSHEIASHDPAHLPRVIWLNDDRPRHTDPETWNLQIADSRVAIETLIDRAKPVTATLDCTGGWWSEQVWDAVPLAELVVQPTGRSVYVESLTGYGRHFPISDLANLYLAVGYGGELLRAGHGAPARLVVPGRRGPEWVKWVARVECRDRPAWAQPPLPLS